MKTQEQADSKQAIIDAAIGEADLTEGLNDQQRAAFHELHKFALGQTDHAMAVLRGWAGTGKTYLVSRLIHALGGSGMSIAIAAPTNKAVRVLREKIVETGIDVPDEPTDQKDPRALSQSWIEFGSIHSLLGLKLSERDDGTQECRSARNPSLHEYDLAIIDEASMVGSDLFSRIVAAKRRCLVLFVGDPAQLPPIEAGEAISPTFTRVSLDVALSDVVRQAKDNPIIQLATALRQAIESERRVDHSVIADALPPLNENPAAAMVQGGMDTAANFALFERKAGRDARILAFTNQTVQQYNFMIHEALYGRTEFVFVPGEPVIAHAACEARNLDDDGKEIGTKSHIITSEEATVRMVEKKSHPYWPDIPSAAVTLERDNGSLALVYIPLNMAKLESAISEQFAQWRELKNLADLASQQGRAGEERKLRDEAKVASKNAWKLRKAFAPLRHAYALTTHKSQGSTFDTAIVDLSDMTKMRSAFQFNRGLYVAATRPRQYLAIVA